MPNETFITLDLQEAIWDRVFMVVPLVVIGTREGDSRSTNTRRP